MFLIFMKQIGDLITDCGLKTNQNETLTMLKCDELDRTLTLATVCLIE